MSQNPAYVTAPGIPPSIDRAGEVFQDLGKLKWPMVQFGQLYAEASRNGIYKSREHHGTGVKIVNMGELFANDIINRQQMKRVHMTDTEMSTSGLADGDLLFGRRSLVESGAGKCSLVEGLTEPTTFESSIIRVRLNRSLIRARFVFYWLKSRQGLGSVQAIVTGTNVKGIRGSVLKRIEVPCPRLSVQDAVVSMLSAYDDFIENNRRRILALDKAALLLYRQWFVRFRFPGCQHVTIADGVPENWEKKPLGEIADVVMGQSPQSIHYNETGDGFFFHQGVSNFGVRFPSHKTYCTVLGRVAEPGDILFSVRAPVGRINVTIQRIVIGRGIAAIRSIRDQQNYLFYALRDCFFKDDMIGGGSIFAAVTKKVLHRVELIQAPDRIAEAFLEHVRPIDRQIEVLHDTAEALCQARRLLLPYLMSGRTIRVDDHSLLMEAPNRARI